MAIADALSALQGKFPDIDFAPQPLCKYVDGRDSGQQCVTIPADRLLDVAQFLYDDDACRFDYLSDITCVDYLNFPDADDRFGVTYNFVSTKLNHRLFAKVYVNDPNPTVPTLTGIWKGAEWTEREVYDMFGVKFSDHPDLRRILLPPNFKDHPLRKDYPLRGKGEREAFDVLTKESA